MLKVQPNQPEWVDIMPGVRIEFEPIGIKAVRAAREAVRETLGDAADDIMAASDALSRVLLRRGIKAWEGVGDRHGVEIPVTPENVELFLDDPRAFEAADWAYVRPWAMRDLEGNASAGSQTGTGAAETPADDIAPSPAKPIAKAAAKNAPTGSMSRRRKKPRPSGKS